MKEINPILLTDTYNLSHQFLKKNTDFEVCHYYNRTNPIIFDGITDIIEKFLTIKITRIMVDEAETYAKENNMPFPRNIWDRVVDEFDGCIPIQIQAVKEGTYCPTYTPVMQIRNTEKGMGEMISWLEPILMKVFLASSTLYRANEMRKYLDSLVEDYGESILWKFHSFGFRGSNSLEDAITICKSWSTRLHGTDDFHVNKYIKQDGDVIKIGSISAQAHKVVEQFENEIDAYYHAIDQVKALGTNIVALVIDTYCPYNFINNIMEKVVRYAIEKEVHVVLRPDSKDVMEQAVMIWNKKKELNLTNVSVIIGDGISYNNYKEKDMFLLENGVPLDFVFYGIGGGFYKDIVRDTDGWASKVAFSNGEPVMKFSADDFKVSIPNIVHLKYDEDKNMVVHDGDSNEGLYETIYYCDKNQPANYKKPKSREDYVEFSKYVASQNTSQERIILSEETIALKEIIRSKKF